MDTGKAFYWDTNGLGQEKSRGHGLGPKIYERLKELGMSIVSQRREEMELSEMYKIMTGKSAVDPGVWFEKVSRDGVVTGQEADQLNFKILAARPDSGT